MEPNEESPAEEEQIESKEAVEEPSEGQENVSPAASSMSTEEVNEVSESDVEDSKLEGEPGEEIIEEAPIQVPEVKTKEEKEREREKKEKLVPYVEAALFLAGRPISELELAEHLGSDRLTVRWALRRIKRQLQEQNSALEILNPTKDRWVLQLCEEFSRGLYDYIEQFIPKEAMLSREEIDTLTEIAYRQPITSALLVKIVGGQPYMIISDRSMRRDLSFWRNKSERISSEPQQNSRIFMDLTRKCEILRFNWFGA